MRPKGWIVVLSVAGEENEWRELRGGRVELLSGFGVLEVRYSGSSSGYPVQGIWNQTSSAPQRSPSRSSGARLAPRETSIHDYGVAERDFSCHCRPGDGGGSGDIVIRGRPKCKVEVLDIIH